VSQTIVAIEVRASSHGPARGRVVGAVEQIEDGVALGALLVSGRRVNPDCARLALENLGLLPVDLNSAVRHTARFPESGWIALHFEKAGRSARPQLDAWIDGIGDREAIDGERINIDTRLERPQRDT